MPTAQDYYFDEEENKGRSVDIAAIQLPEVSEDFKIVNPLDPFRLEWDLAIECKKEKANWVFFPVEDYYPGTSGQYFCFLQDEKKFTLLSHLIGPGFGHYKLRDKLASTYARLPLKGKDEIFEAVMQLVKYISYTKHQTIERIADLNLSEFIMHFWFPIIVFDGQIWDVFIEKGEISKVVETNHTLLKMQYRSTYTQEERYFMVDIVHRSYFPELLTLISNDIGFYESYIIKNKENLLARFKWDSRGVVK